MTQLRKIVDVDGETWSLPAALCAVLPHPTPGRGVVAVVGWDPPGVEVESRSRAEHILTMRDPARHCDPLPDWMERPDVGPEYLRGSAVWHAHQVGVEARRRGRGLNPAGMTARAALDALPIVEKAFLDLGSDMAAKYYTGYAELDDIALESWGAQDEIAVDFYDEHVVGWGS